MILILGCFVGRAPDTSTCDSISGFPSVDKSRAVHCAIPDNITPMVHQWLWAAKKPLVDHQWHTGGNLSVGFATDGPPVVHHRQTM